MGIRLNLWALKNANVKKQASSAQLFANAVENVHELSCREENNHFYAYNSKEFSFNDFNFRWFSQ